MVFGILGVSLVTIQSHIAMRTSFLIYWMTLPNFSSLFKVVLVENYLPIKQDMQETQV